MSPRRMNTHGSLHTCVCFVYSTVRVNSLCACARLFFSLVSRLDAAAAAELEACEVRYRSTYLHVAFQCLGNNEKATAEVPICKYICVEYI